MAAAAVNDVYSVIADGHLDVGDPGVLGNDGVPAGSKVKFAAGPFHGSLAGSGISTGSFSYTPDPGYRGLDTFGYCLIASGSDTSCVSNVATVIIHVGSLTVTRIGGADRFAVAAEISRRTNPGSSDTVFIASGETFADALSVAPAATKSDSALLLVRHDTVPAPTANELRRLRPAKIVVVGGPATVSDAVLRELTQFAPVVTRITGSDRFEVSRRISTELVGHARHAVLATGVVFPDALTAGAVAGAADEPVLLVDGSAVALDSPTYDVLRALGVTDVTIVGGPRSVSPGLEADAARSFTVTRVSGSDRYEVAVALQEHLTHATPVFLATGQNFPDALVGGRLAGQATSALYIAPGTCVPAVVLADIARIGADELILLGGENSLTDAVARLEPCR